MAGRGVSQVMKRKAYITDSGMLTAYGLGTSKTWDGLMSGTSAIKEVDRFSCKAFKASSAGIVEGLSYHGKTGDSLVMQMLKRLLEGVSVEPDTKLYLATTKGEIDLLEQAVLKGSVADSRFAADNIPAAASVPSVLLDKVRRMLSLDEGGTVISAACASGSTALARAASDVSSGRAKNALVIACDSVTEFVYSGFSSLMAIDALGARPFDSKRAGLSVGEAAAYAVVSDNPGKGNEGKAIEIAGWGMSSDANHMTGPSRDGRGLSVAIKKALDMAGLGPDDIASVSAHGTGTGYNDSMEMKAFKLALGDRTCPVYSVKGGMGHSMGAAGLVEALLAARSLSEQRIPPTVGMSEADEDASGWVSGSAQEAPGLMALTTNSGFGGINAALVLKAAA